jgi:hypothetical protein
MGMVSGMTRLWPSIFLVCLAGCSGQDVTGRWKGGWPLAEAEDCRTQLSSSGAFDLVCAGDAWVGVGRYQRADDRLIFRFSALTRRGEVVKSPAPSEFVVVGRGNEMDLKQGATAFVWTRVLASEDAK